MLRRIGFVSLAAALAGAPALAQSMTCEPDKPCSASDFTYTPGDESVRAFGEVVFHLDGRKLKSLGESSRDEGALVTAAYGDCYIGVMRFREPYPSAKDDPDHRANLARESLKDEKDKLPAFPAVSGTSGEIVRADPGLAIGDLR